MIDFEQKAEVSRILDLVNALHSELEKEMAIFGDVLELSNSLTNVLMKANVRGIFDMDDIACKFLSNYPLTDEMIKSQVDVIGNAIHTLRKPLKELNITSVVVDTLYEALKATGEAYEAYDVPPVVAECMETVKAALVKLL